MAAFKFDFALPEPTAKPAAAVAPKDFRFDFMAKPAPTPEPPAPSAAAAVEARQLHLDDGARIEADYRTVEVDLGAGVAPFRIVDTDGLTLPELADTAQAPADVIPGVYEGGLKARARAVHPTRRSAPASPRPPLPRGAVRSGSPRSISCASSRLTPKARPARRGAGTGDGGGN